MALMSFLIVFFTPIPSGKPGEKKESSTPVYISACQIAT
jgi:hypothetical protein